MILECDDTTHVTAIEAVSESLQMADKTLRGFYDSTRYHLIHGLAGKVNLNLGSDIPIKGLVAEILGHFGSSEGYVSILLACHAAYPFLRDTIEVAVPRYFGTRFVPVDLSRGTDKLVIGSIQKRLALFSKFPFRETELCSQHQNMEMYDALMLLREGPRGCGYVFRSVWCMEKNGRFDGLGLYVVYGDSLAYLQTSNKDDAIPAATSWMNVFIPSPKRCSVCVGDVIECVVTCHVECPEPSYRFEVSVHTQQGGGGKWSYVNDICYRDIICRVLPISKAMQNMQVLLNAMRMQV